jgi:hypothetical protein
LVLNHWPHSKLAPLLVAYKLYGQLLKEEVNTIISRYTLDKSSSLLPTKTVTMLRSEVTYFRDRFGI